MNFGPFEAEQQKDGMTLVRFPDGPPRGATNVEIFCFARIAELEAPYRNADAKDWEWLMNHLGHSGHGQFWKAVMTEARVACAKALRK